MHFRQRIRESINNPTLQKALEANTERRLKGRALAFESIPDWRERRQLAHAIRADVIEHLDDYLAQFIAKSEENGVIVHRAKDAAEAIQIILDVGAGLVPARTQTQQNESQAGRPQGSPLQNLLIAKSKSMVSEEIALNHALEAEGIEVIETDLGEYIVQLRHERPSHIITPAVHLTRQQVAALFHEKLGIPYTEDIPTLTATARKILRQVFLTADIGLSGVNFGVAETGALCIITNEGNGRMVTTLPPVHIAIMGMERIVPNLGNLALMLSLLPRSATGQKLTVYTQLLNKPIANQQRHLIILDNGRTRLRNSPLKESLYCIRCGACLNACPVFRKLSGHAYIGTDGSIAPYPGPIGSVISPGLLGANYIQLAQASSLCGACKDICPVDIDLPKLLSRVRAGESPSPTGMEVRAEGGAGLSQSSKLFMRIYSRIATHPRLFTASQRFAALGTSVVSPFSEMFHIPLFTGWGYSKDFPRFAAKPFRAGFKKVTESEVFAQRPVRAGLRRDIETPVFETPTSGDVRVQENKVERFTKELIALGGHVTPTNDPTQTVIEFLRAREINRIHLEPDTLNESLLTEANITFTHVPDPAIKVGVTKTVCGLADTGSVLIMDGDGSPLQASLLPEIHIAILHTSKILHSLENAMPLVRDSKAAVFISGPSRTADIEMTLTIGVHGPGELHVLLVDG